MPERNWNGHREKKRCHRRCLKLYRRIIRIHAGRYAQLFLTIIYYNENTYEEDKLIIALRAVYSTYFILKWKN